VLSEVRKGTRKRRPTISICPVDVRNVSDSPISGGIAWCCAFLSAASIVTVAAIGIPLQGELSGHDADFALRSLVFLEKDWSAPGFPPAWFTESDWGFGAPIFQYYPPFAHLLAIVIASITNADPALALALTVATARLTSLATAYIWLRGRVGSKAALLGASAYTVMPYVALVDPVVRFAFSEGVCSALIPLLFWTLDQPALRQRVTGFSLVFAGCLITNVPASIVCGLCAGFYSVRVDWRRGVEAAAAASIGIGLSSWYIVPALLTVSSISTQALPDTGRYWLLELAGLDSYLSITPLHLFLFTSGAVPLIFIAALASVHDRLTHEREILETGSFALLAATPIGLPFWFAIGPLRFVQFPWRFLLPSCLFAGAAVALLAQHCAKTSVKRWLIVGSIVLSAVGPATGLFVLDSRLAGHSIRFGWGPDRISTAMLDFEPWEYIPAPARKAGWFPWLERGLYPPNVSRKPVVVSGMTKLTSFTRSPGCLYLSGDASGPAEIVLPQFWHPRWALFGHAEKMTDDKPTGLIRISVSSGPFDVSIERAPVPFSGLGGLATVTSGILLATLWISAAIKHRWRCALPLITLAVSGSLSVSSSTGLVQKQSLQNRENLKTLLPKSSSGPAKIVRRCADDTNSTIPGGVTPELGTVTPDTTDLLAVRATEHGRWAVGRGGAILSSRSSAGTWHRQLSPSESFLSAVWFRTDGQYGWTVGDRGTILTTADGGRDWKSQTAPTGDFLYAVWFDTDARVGRVVGDRGTMLVTKNGGEIWESKNTGTSQSFYGTYFTPDGEQGWAVGRAGTLVVTSDGGETWTAQTSGTTSTLYAVSFAADQKLGWIVGRDGLILATSDGGQTWRAQESGTTNPLFAVYISRDGRRGCAVGRAGTIVTTDDGGASWRTREGDTNKFLYGVDFAADGRKGWVVGQNGIILTTSDGGATWSFSSSDLAPENVSTFR
jgi:photosystem II stability/assembly factor-like uncharacterized protein